MSILKTLCLLLLVLFVGCVATKEIYVQPKLSYLTYYGAEYVPQKHDRFYEGEDRDFMFEQYDFSGVGKIVFGGTQDRWYNWATLVTEHVFITSKHWSGAFKVGTKVGFWLNNDTNTTFISTVTWIRPFGTDHCIGGLNPPPPPEYKRYPIQDRNSRADWNYYKGFIYVGKKPQPEDYGFAVGIRKTENQLVSSDPERKDETVLIFDEHWDYQEEPSGVYGIPGDSSAPTFVDQHGKLAVVGTHYRGHSDALYTSEKLNEQISMAPSNQEERVIGILWDGNNIPDPPIMF